MSAHRTPASGQCLGPGFAFLAPELDCTPARSIQAWPRLAGAQGAWEGALGGRDRRGTRGSLVPPSGLKSSLPHTSRACPLVPSWGWFCTRDRFSPSFPPAALVMFPPQSPCQPVLPTQPPSPDPEYLNHPGHSPQGKGGRQTPRPRHQDLSDPLPFLPCPSCPPPAFPVLSWFL